MRSMLAASLAVAALAGAASADVRVWDWTPSVGGSVNNAAGTIESIRATYNTITQDFSWSVTFANQVTDGFTLALSPGPNPKGHPAELALMYFDGRSGSTPKLTVYAYNGQNTQTSWQDGSPASGTQTPDRIVSSLLPSFTPTLSVVNANGKRTMSMAFNAAAIQGHSPAYPPSNDWTGLAFGEQIGVWFHPVDNLSATYGGNKYLSSWNAGVMGWLDGNCFPTVPTPGSVALLGLGAVAIGVRRRR